MDNRVGNIFQFNRKLYQRLTFVFVSKPFKLFLES